MSNSTVGKIGFKLKPKVWVRSGKRDEFFFVTSSLCQFLLLFCWQCPAWPRVWRPASPEIYYFLVYYQLSVFSCTFILGLIYISLYCQVASQSVWATHKNFEVLVLNKLVFESCFWPSSSQHLIRTYTKITLATIHDF